jgi:hypothetical protein
MSQSLRRTASYITLPGLEPPAAEDTLQVSKSSDDLVPYHRTLRYYKEQRERRKAMLHRKTPVASLGHNDQITIHIPKAVSAAPRTFDLTAALSPAIRPRVSSPLAPKRTVLPPRASFPRSKPEPNLYKMAITARMQRSPTGQKILTMGPRLALAITSATKELEKMVGQQQQHDVVMVDGTTMSTSWVVVPGEDWEMVDCGA